MLLSIGHLAIHSMSSNRLSYRFNEPALSNAWTVTTKGIRNHDNCQLSSINACSFTATYGHTELILSYITKKIKINMMYKPNQFT